MVGIGIGYKSASGARVKNCEVVVAGEAILWRARGGDCDRVAR